MKIPARLILALAVLLLCVVAIAPIGNASASNVFDSPLPTAIPPVATVAPTAAPMPTLSAPPPIPTAAILGTHIVKPGESLYCIGRAYGVSPWAIASTNGVPWPYTIFIGRALKIPDVRWFNIPAGPVCVKQFDVGPVPTPSPTTIPPTPGPLPTPIPGACAQSYVIQPGDTLYWIAWRFGVDVNTLAARNHITNINLIYAWTTICIK